MIVYNLGSQYQGRIKSLPFRTKFCCRLILGNVTDYGRPVRKSPSLHGRKSTHKFLGTAEAHFVCNIGPNFQISLIHASIGCPLSVHYRKHQLYRSTEKAFRPPGGVTILYGLHNQYISLEVHPKSATFSQIDYRPSS